jgi:hypothetical protein
MTEENILVPSVYAGNLVYYKQMKGFKNVHVEVCEHYVKQTYRSRCSIYGANGKLDLIIPVEKGKQGHRPMKEVKISYAERWQRIHWKSLESAYRTSPYFEYYEHALAPFYEKQTEYLVDFNAALNETLLKLLGLEVFPAFTTTYHEHPENMIDLRDLADPVVERPGSGEPYTQVFENKKGFIGNLSVYDLLFNCGPRSLDHL